MTREAHQVWWLNPAWIAGLMGLAVSMAAYLIPETLYIANWKTPKFFTLEPLLLSLGLTLAFVLGCLGTIGGAPRKLGPTREWQADVPWRLFNRCFWACVILTLVAYVIWAAVAISRGATMGLALGVLRGEKGAVYEMKDAYLGTISGVTTLTQLGIVAMVIGIMIGTVQGWNKVVWPLLLIFGLSVVRALFNAERLAIVELVVPAVVIAIRLVLLESPRYRGRLKTVMQLAPMAGGGLLLLLFAVFEYFRSWTTFYAGGDLSFWEFVSLRLLGYYVTALNNGALMVARIETLGAPFATLHFMWRLPPFNGLMHLIYPNLLVDNADFDPYLQILDREANQEFNNPSGLLPPVVDFGVPGALLFWLLAGLLCGLLYRWFRECKVPGLLMYPVFFTGIIETTRIIYWGEGRAVAAYVVLVPLAWLCAVWTRPAHHGQERSLLWPR